MKFLVCALLSLCLSPVLAEELTVKSQIYYQVAGSEEPLSIGDRLLFTEAPSVIIQPVGIIRVDSEASNIEVVASDGNRFPVEVERITENIYVVSKSGEIWVDVSAIDFEKKIYGRKTVLVKIGEAPPVPPTPVPPGPQPPEPTPPDPSADAPIEGPGLRVLFVHETSELLAEKYTEGFYGADVSAYLNTHAFKVDGQPEFRRVDPDARFTDPNHRFAKALARPRTSDPWLIISNGATGYEGPFPESKQVLLDLIQQFTPLESAPPDDVKVTMITTANCPPCLEFKSNQLPRMSTPVEVTDVIPQGIVIRSFPSFVLQKGNARVVVSNCTTAEQLQTFITRMEENN